VHEMVLRPMYAFDAGVWIHRSDAVHVGDKHHNDRIFAGCLDCIKVHMRKPVAHVDLLALLHLCLESLSVKVDGIDSQMHEHIEARGGADAIGMSGRKDGRDGAGYRSEDIARDRILRVSLAKSAAGNHRICDIGKRHVGAFDGSRKLDRCSAGLIFSLLGRDEEPGESKGHASCQDDADKGKREIGANIGDEAEDGRKDIAIDSDAGDSEALC
jgi:hypothetical protein